jgi:hypothetical protein
VHVKLVAPDVGNVQVELVEADEVVGVDELDDEGNFGVEALGVDSAVVDDVFVAEALGVGVGRGALLLDCEVELLVEVEVEVEILWQKPASELHSVPSPQPLSQISVSANIPKHREVIETYSFRHYMLSGQARSMFLCHLRKSNTQHLGRIHHPHSKSSQDRHITPCCKLRYHLGSIYHLDSRQSPSDSSCHSHLARTKCNVISSCEAQSK